jgi:hypothetical protein
MAPRLVDVLPTPDAETTRQLLALLTPATDTDSIAS